MQGQGKELAALDFANIIGGPLIAVIHAQAKAAHVTSNFIQHIAFEKPQSGSNQTKLKTVEFDYGQVIGNMGGGVSGIKDATVIKVPLLTMIPIPYIRIESMTIDLNVNLHDVSKQSLTNDFTFSSQEQASEGSDMGIWNESVSFSASVSDKNTYQNDSTTDDTYSLRVTVHAVQDQMPAGLGQILNIFSNVIQQQSALIQTIMTAEIQAKTAEIQQALGSGSQASAPTQ